MNEKLFTKSELAKKLGISYKISYDNGNVLIEETFGLGDSLLKSIKVLMFKNEHNFNIKKKSLKSKFKKYFSLYGYLHKRNLKDEISVLDEQLIYLNTHIKIKYIPPDAQIKISSSIKEKLERQAILTNINIILRYPYNYSLENKKEPIIFCDLISHENS